MPSVTVNGASGQFVVVNYDTAAYAALAQKYLSAAGNSGPTVTNAAFLISAAGNDTIPPGSVITGVGNLDGPGPGLGSVYVTDASTATDQLVLDGSGTNMLFSATGGGGTLLTGSGNDTISVASGWYIQTEGSGDQIYASGTDTIATGGANLVVATGNDTVFGNSSGGTSVFGGSNGTLTYVGGAGTASVAAGSGGLVAYGGSGGTNYTLTNGNATINGGAGANDTINGGVGVVTYFGADNGSVSFNGSSSNNLFVATGNATINGSASSGANVFYAGNGNDSISGGDGGGNILWSGSGNDTLTGGGPGYNLFGFAAEAGGGSTTITDWNSTDHLDLQDTNIASQTEDNGNLIVTLTDNTQVTFTGLTTDLTSGQYTLT